MMFCSSDNWDDQKSKIEAGKALRHARKSRNLTQENIEEKVHRYKNAFTNYENGNTSMDFVTLVRTVTVLDMCRKLSREEQLQIAVALMKDNWVKESEKNRI